MRRTLAPILAVLAIIAAGILLANATPSAADPGGCPHEFPADKPGKTPNRPVDCVGRGHTPSPAPTVVPGATETPTPTPPPTPTSSPTPSPAPPPTTPPPTPEPSPTPSPSPTPAATADLVVDSVTVVAPASPTRGVAFPITGMAAVRNGGTVPTVIADVTFTAHLPPDCTASSPTTVTVLNRTLTVGSPVFVSRSWNVTCTQPDVHQFTIDASTAISPGQAATDPDLTNNSRSGVGATQVN